MRATFAARFPLGGAGCPLRRAAAPVFVRRDSHGDVAAARGGVEGCRDVVSDRHAADRRRFDRGDLLGTGSSLRRDPARRGARDGAGGRVDGQSADPQRDRRYPSGGGRRRGSSQRQPVRGGVALWIRGYDPGHRPLAGAGIARRRADYDSGARQLFSPRSPTSRC